MNEGLFLTHLVGQSINTYLIEEPLEQWEMGAICLAHSTISNRPCRLHLLRLPEHLSSEERMILFGHFQHQTHELMHILSKNETSPEHPHLLPLIDAGHTQHFLYLVAPSVSTKTLSTLLETQGPLDALTVSIYLDQIASALEYAHQHACLHGNLTTDVVLLHQNQGCVIADLGVRQILELNWPGQSLVSFPHSRPSVSLAPEQLRGQASHTTADVYALGAILYRLLTGHRVFRGESQKEIVEQHLHAPVPSLAIWRHILVGRIDVTVALDRLLAAALTKDPHQRIQNPAQLANAYHQIVAPNDRQRQSVRSPLGETTVTSWSDSTENGEGTRGEQYLRRKDARMVEARRRALLFLGGGAVTVGMLACVASQVVNRGRSISSPTITGSTTGPTTDATTGPTTGSPSGGQATSSPGGSTASGNVIARSSAVPVNSALTFPNPNQSSPQPGVLVHLPNGQFVAFDSTCTHHASCAVQYVSQDKLLECPCHGAAFDPTNRASVVQGPAPSPLASIAITVHPDGTITAE